MYMLSITVVMIKFCYSTLYIIQDYLQYIFLCLSFFLSSFSIPSMQQEIQYAELESFRPPSQMKNGAKSEPKPVQPEEPVSSLSE